MQIDRTVTTLVDTVLCNGCGRCIHVCPSQTITLKKKKALVSGQHSLACDHCAAICPTEAIRVKAIDPEASRLKLFPADNRWLPHGDFNTSKLIRLMRSRRSCRNYTDKPVDRSLLEDLVKIGVTAPSGSNCQQWTFTVLPSRQGVTALGNRIALFFKRLNRLAEKRFLRGFLKLLGKPQLHWYFREYYQSVEDALSEWERTGTDRLFHGASAIIIVGSRPGAACPAEDALLATQNILLGAHSMGLGTCLIGFAVEALQKDRKIKQFLNIPKIEDVHAVIALGHPREKYLRVTGRKKFVFRYYEHSSR
jgi:nitroreductase/Pyruvate/2-oxoacid:ferredoxin oxidoreductase delta subunit